MTLLRTTRLALCSLATLVAACATLPEGVPDAERPWLRARVYVPGRLLATTPDAVVAERRMPVLVYLHGCTGLTAHDTHWAGYFKDLGFIVVQPDSFARVGRKPNCDPRTNTTGLYPGSNQLRAAELLDAVARVRSAAWADRDTVFVMGHSEGGFTAMREVVSGVRGTIVSGHYCPNPSSRISIPHPTADRLLILEWQTDPWNRLGTTCQTHLAGRTATTFVRLPGGGHGTAESRTAREAVRAFVRQDTRASSRGTEQ
ncbi:MAG: hypothetical protein ABIU95_11910 [Burkholderiales bacterium]